MEWTTYYLVRSAVVAAISNVAVMAEVYFQRHDSTTRVNCYDHVISNGVAASTSACAYNCGWNDLCRAFVYEPTSMNCTEIHELERTNYLDRLCQAGTMGVYAKEACIQPDYLVDGPRGVSNSQLTESSYYYGSNRGDADSRTFLSAWYSRLSSRGAYFGAWAADYLDTYQYVQVYFQQPTMVSSVVLTGKDPAYNWQYITSFKFLYSDDCLLFREIAYENGSSVTLEGNSDPYEIVTRHLPDGVQARCFRINPVTWYGWPSLRFDLKGCRSDI